MGGMHSSVGHSELMHDWLPDIVKGTWFLYSVQVHDWSRLCRLQANYQLILPDVETYLEHIGSASSWSGIVIGCCDVATLPGALGQCAYHMCLLHHPYPAHALWVKLAVSHTTAASQTFHQEPCCLELCCDQLLGMACRISF